MLEQPHNALRCRTAVGWLAHCHAAKAKTGYTVDVFFQGDHVEARALIDMRGNRVLQQNAMHVWVLIQLLNLSQKVIGASRLQEVQWPEIPCQLCGTHCLSF